MVNRFLSVLFVLFVLLSLTPLKSPTYAGVNNCSSCTKSNCCGVVCTTTEYCSGDVIYGCECKSLSSNDPTPTDPPEVNPLPTLPHATTIPNITLSPYETACGGGKCTNGYYCCQQPNGDPACCPVGEVPPGGGGNRRSSIFVQLLDPNLIPFTPPRITYCPPTRAPTIPPLYSPTPQAVGHA